ncbi:MAG: hypothetical protein J6W63_03155 [Treponema sp.]|nr:hypothetical protein [Treponema sp.]
MAAIDFQQTLKQSQLQVMSQKQIQVMNMLAMSSSDLREEIYRQAEENPALELRERGSSLSKKMPSPSRKDSTRITSNVSQAAQEASKTYQQALESKKEFRKSLKANLLSQLHMEDLSKEEMDLGEKLIYNLSDKGFHMLSPISFIDKGHPEQKTEMLNKIISLIQSFYPEGCCTKNSEESLYVQARLKDKNQHLALFILNGRLDFINPPLADRATKKIISYLSEQKKMFALKEDDEISKIELSDVTEDSVQKAIDFIRTLTPFPAQEFDINEAHYVAPDVYVEELPSATESESLPEEDFANGLVVYKPQVGKQQVGKTPVSKSPVGKDAAPQATVWKVRAAKDRLPALSIDKTFEQYADLKNKAVTEGIKKARDFIESIQYRQDTLLSAVCIIVKMQHEFFKKGPGHLAALKQKDVADILGVHETTISRMANSKYIQCQWGLFEVKYFFTNAVSDTSKDQVLFQIKQILEEHKNDSKKLSDQKVADALAAKGINVARRTVAKYRAQLNIESSYNRQ